MAGKSSDAKIDRKPCEANFQPDANVK